ncbi:MULTISPECIES: hypothetical protein [unclassified Acidisoma]|jgi:hypothetical protein|uniref:hypothetical protein n=1 Tax=unclassified Acidisoma TaxID=2634065 RepID=UPI00131A8FC0|nr:MULTISPECIES: hypothetical protein [unclassified Acidisoma]
MAYFKEASFLELESGPEYDMLFPPGQEAPYAGVYRCEVCALCVVSEFSNRLPSDDHHQHRRHSEHPIRWRLAVKAHY